MDKTDSDHLIQLASIYFFSATISSSQPISVQQSFARNNPVDLVGYVYIRLKPSISPRTPSFFSFLLYHFLVTVPLNIVKWVVDYLMFTFSAFVDQSVANRGIQELEADLTDIVTKALRWQDQARTRHYTYDYVGFLPLESSPFVEAEMDMESEVDGVAHSAKRVVMLPLSMGLKASRSEASANGQTRAHKVLKKAQVLVG